MIKIYFAHAIADYDTDYEQKCLDLIAKHYPDSVIHNPKDLDKIINKNMPEIGKFKGYYFPQINKCDILIAAPVFNHKRRGELLSGTLKEISYASKHNKQIKIIINNKIEEPNEILKDIINFYFN